MKTTAREFAIQKHGDQKYGDQPYVVHLDHVHEVLSRYYPGIMQAYRDAAYLHDVLEDTETTVEETLTFCRNLYNTALEQRKLHHKQSKSWGLENPINRFAQSHQLVELKQQLPEYQTANSQVLQDVVTRLG